MPDYKEMYLHLMRKTEKAIQLLVKAQRDCEELYLQENGPALQILPAQDPAGADSEEESPASPQRPAAR